MTRSFAAAYGTSVICFSGSALLTGPCGAGLATLSTAIQDGNWRALTSSFTGAPSFVNEDCEARAAMVVMDPSAFSG